LGYHQKLNCFKLDRKKVLRKKGEKKFFKIF